MTSTLPYIKLTPNSYVDVFAATGIPTGTPLIIQSLSTKPIKIYKGALQPPVDTDKYIVLIHNMFAVTEVTASEGCWLLGTDLASVQVIEPEPSLGEYKEALSEIIVALSENTQALDLLNAKFEEAWDTKIFTRDV